MSETTPVTAPSRTHTPTDEVERLLDAAFEADYHRCVCGSMVLTRETWCYPCATGNRARGPIYGASLAGPSLRPGYPTPTAPITVDWSSATGDLRDACRRIDALLDQNDALALERDNLARQVAGLKAAFNDAHSQADVLRTERDDLARQVVSLKGALDAQAAAVRASKAGATE